jgi:hypothetical protein
MISLGIAARNAASVLLRGMLRGTLRDLRVVAPSLVGHTSHGR